MSLKNWLNSSYPLIQKGSVKGLLVVGFSLFTWIFLMVYQPFGATEIRENRNLFLLGFGLMVGVGLSATYFLLPLWFGKFFEEEAWKVKKEILYISLSLLLVSVLNYLYNSLVGATFAPQHSLAEFVGITLAVGIFPIIIMVFLVERFLSRRNRSEALRLNDRIGASQELEKLSLQIQPDSLKARPFELNIEDFVFARSDNNYLSIYYFDKGQFRRELIRLSMKKLEEQLEPYEGLVRCHRSYLVNKSRVKKFQGNARSLNLELEGYEGLVPVARSLAREWLD